MKGVVVWWLYCMLIIRAGWQRKCWCPSLPATSSSESARAGLATPSHTGECLHDLKKGFNSEFTLTHSEFKVLLFSLFDSQCWGPSQTLHDWCVGGWSLHHIGGEQAPPVSAGLGGLSSKDSHHALHRGADCRLRTGEEMFYHPPCKQLPELNNHFTSYTFIFIVLTILFCCRVHYVKWPQEDCIFTFRDLQCHSDLKLAYHYYPKLHLHFCRLCTLQKESNHKLLFFSLCLILH